MNVFKELVGKTLSKVEVNESKDVITFTTIDNEVFELYHEQDCCESVYIEDIVGDLDDLIGSPILLAEESLGGNDIEITYKYAESCTWTFYRLGTKKGFITIRWYGESNGYYSESVDFKKWN